MSEAKFRTMRHIETVRNHLNIFLREIIDRQEKHDQSKLEHPELKYTEQYHGKLRLVKYNSKAYKQLANKMREGITFHVKKNSHHPEYYNAGIIGMDLLDLIEMLCDWKAAGMRRKDGCLLRSLDINREKHGISPQLYWILRNTIQRYLNNPRKKVFHKAHES